MDRASDSLRAERLNRARKLLQQFRHIPVAVVQMAIDCGLSPRQAYRYLQQARCSQRTGSNRRRQDRLYVKLSQELARRLRCFAHTTDLSLSEIVSRALLAALPQKQRRR